LFVDAIQTTANSVRSIINRDDYRQKHLEDCRFKMSFFIFFPLNKNIEENLIHRNQ